MSKLDDLIRERGCDDLTAIQWLKEKSAFVHFRTDSIHLVVDPGSWKYHGKSLSEVVLLHVQFLHRCEPT